MSAQNKNSELFTQDLRFNHHLSREVFPTCEFFDKHGKHLICQAERQEYNLNGSHFLSNENFHKLHK